MCRITDARRSHRRPSHLRCALLGWAQVAIDQTRWALAVPTARDGHPVVLWTDIVSVGRISDTADTCLVERTASRLNNGFFLWRTEWPHLRPQMSMPNAAEA